jgi:hypothetical protein
MSFKVEIISSDVTGKEAMSKSGRLGSGGLLAGGVSGVGLVRLISAAMFSAIVVKNELNELAMVSGSEYV